MKVKGKKTLKLIAASDVCPLRHSERLVYSVLDGGREFGKGYRASEISEITGCHESLTVPAALRRLREADLAELRADGRHYGKLPGEKTNAWFRFFAAKNGERVMAYTRVMLPAEGSPLTVRQCLLMGLLQSLSRDGGKTVKNLTYQYLARITGQSRKTVTDAVATLRDAGLIAVYQSKDASRMAFRLTDLTKLSAVQRAFFRDLDNVRHHDNTEYPGLDDDGVVLVPVVESDIIDDTDEDDEDVQDAASVAMLSSGYTPLQMAKCREIAVSRGLTVTKFLEYLAYCDARFARDRFASSAWMLAARLKKLPRKKRVTNVSDTGRRNDDRTAGEPPIHGVAASVPGGTEDPGTPDWRADGYSYDPSMSPGEILLAAGYTSEEAATLMGECGKKGIMPVDFYTRKILRGMGKPTIDQEIIDAKGRYEFAQRRKHGEI